MLKYSGRRPLLAFPSLHTLPIRDYDMNMLKILIKILGWLFRIDLPSKRGMITDDDPRGYSGTPGIAHHTT